MAHNLNSHPFQYTGLYLVRYNNATGSFFTVEVPLTTSSDRPAQWEETTFAVAGINNIPPAVNVCFVGFWSGTSYSATPFKLDPGQPTPIPFYGYDTVARWSPFLFQNLKSFEKCPFDQNLISLFHFDNITGVRIHTPTLQMFLDRRMTPSFSTGV